MPQGIILSQNKFTKDLLHDCDFDLSVKAVTPLPLNLKLKFDEGVLLDDPEIYRSFVGKLDQLPHKYQT